MKRTLDTDEPLTDVAEEATERLRNAKDRVSEAYDKTTEAATQFAHDAKGRASEAYDRTAEAATELARDVAEYGKNNPFLTCAVAFGAGLTLGCWLTSARRRDSRGLVPVMAGAVVSVVREVLDARR